MLQRKICFCTRTYADVLVLHDPFAEQNFTAQLLRGIDDGLFNSVLDLRKYGSYRDFRCNRCQYKMAVKVGLGQVLF
jgi:hypothetical protein